MQAAPPPPSTTMTYSSATPSKSKTSITVSTPGPLTPTRRLNPNRACVTTPPRKLKPTSSSSASCSRSPSIHLRTPSSTSKSPVRSSWTSDRFIPNRSQFHLDICRSSIENAERNLSHTFEKLSKRQFDLNVGGVVGGENSPNPRISNSTSPGNNGGNGGAANGIAERHQESITPLQEEFRRRMRGALLNIPLEDVNTSSRIGNASSPVRDRGGMSSSLNGASQFSSVSTSSFIENRENISSVVYASLPDYEEGSESLTGPVSRQSSQRMLCFQGMNRDCSFRSSNSSLTRDDSASDVISACTPVSTPQRKIGRQFSTSTACSSPHRASSVPQPSSTSVVDPFSHDQLHVLHRLASTTNAHNFLPHADSLAMAETRLRSVAKSIGRRIPKTPSRILDAPELVDDYYLNLVSWGENNVLAVALGQCVYLWEAETGNIRHLLTLRNEDDFVTSVAWATMRGNTNYIAVGTNHNAVQLWDAEAERRLRSLDGHSARVGALSWNQHWLSSGGRDSKIIQHDVRSRNHIVSTYVGHTQEVCGLKWNDEGSTLASGGNENLLCLWDASMSRRGNNIGFRQSSAYQHDSSNIGPRLQLTQHKAAVKALAWCPFHRGLLASGGGTADRTIKFWNTNSGAVLNSIDTGSQVCSLLWSKHQREICSSHGFSENQLLLWKYPTMTKIQEFKGHTARVLHMDQSPDSGCVVSAAADETLRFWDVFGSPPNERKGHNLTIVTTYDLQHRKRRSLRKVS
eukprot:CCRYP_006857-RA/>CCRYP_006857-RA protein AED:0.03 eAED:0.03 QI:189/0.75/0.8/1/1/1/5/606/744